MSQGGILTRLRGQEGFGLIEAALIGIAAGIALVGAGYWGAWVAQEEKPPPNISISAPAPLPPPPSNLDEACVQNAYETQGLIWDAAGSGARFEPPNAMWFIPGIVSGSGSVYTPREVEAKVKHRFFLAQRKWTQDCKTISRDDLPSMPQAPTDPRQLYYGTYRLTWIDKTGTASGACPELNQLPTTLTAGSPGESRSGIVITFSAHSGPVEASFGGDRFNTPGEAQSAGFVSTLSGTFVERNGRIEIESGRYEFFQGSSSTSLCVITFTGDK
ncbi:MAG: hypothetical protein ACRDH9_12985 [Actinomycetota bacterium]